MWSGELDQKVGRVLDCICKGASALSEAGATVYTMSNAIQKQGISSFLQPEACNKDTTPPRMVHGHAPHTMTQMDCEEQYAVLHLRLQRAMRDQDASRVRQLACELDELEPQVIAARQGFGHVRIQPTMYGTAVQPEPQRIAARQGVDDVCVLPGMYGTAALPVLTQQPIQRARATNGEAVLDEVHSVGRRLHPPSCTTHIPYTGNIDGLPQASCAGYASATVTLPLNCFHDQCLHSTTRYKSENKSEYTSECKHPPCETVPDRLDSEAVRASAWAEVPCYTQGASLMCAPLALPPIVGAVTSGMMEQHILARGTMEQHTRESSMVQFCGAGMAASGDHATWTTRSRSEAHKTFGSIDSNFSLDSTRHNPASLGGIAASPSDSVLLLEMHALEEERYAVKVQREGVTAGITEDSKEGGEGGSALKDIYEVEAVLDMRETEDNKREFLIKWRGWGAKWNNWEPEEHILDRRMLRKFNKKRSAVPRRPLPEDVNCFTMHSKRRCAKQAAVNARMAARRESIDDAP